VIITLKLEGATTINDRLQPFGLVRSIAKGWAGFTSTPLPILLYASIMVLNDALSYNRELQQRRMRERELEASIARSQLESLRLQLHPHFLFNTLNTVAGLMGKDIEGARRVIARLGDLLHATLREGTTDLWTLGDEARLLSAYVDIQKARFGSRLMFDMVVAEDVETISVPKLVLQPLVENSIHHGMRQDGALHVRVTARCDDDSLMLSVVDDGLGMAAESVAQEGIGLGNTRRRIAALYHGAASLQYRTLQPGFEVVITLPSSEAEA
jgi:LytS/YehU family sensor histidine kinase